MQVNFNIGFKKILEIVLALPANQKNKLIEEIQRKDDIRSNDSYQEFLLSGPVAAKEDLKRIEQTGRDFSEWIN